MNLWFCSTGWETRSVLVPVSPGGRGHQAAPGGQARAAASTPLPHPRLRRRRAASGRSEGRANTDVTSLPCSSYMQHHKRGKGRRYSLTLFHLPLIRNLQRVCKETLKNTVGKFLVFPWRVGTACPCRKAPPLCELQIPECIQILDVFSKRKKMWSKLNFPKMFHI